MRVPGDRLEDDVVEIDPHVAVGGLAHVEHRIDSRLGGAVDYQPDEVALGLEDERAEPLVESVVVGVAG